MSDYLVRLSRRPFMRRVLGGLGVPTPRALERADGPWAERLLTGRRVLVAETTDGGLGEPLQRLLAAAGAEVVSGAGSPGTVDGLVLDATALRSVGDLKALYQFFHGALPALQVQGRVLLLTAPPERAGEPELAAARRGVEGLMRSLAKELGRRAATANLLYVDGAGEAELTAPVTVLLSRHAVYVDGQPLRVGAAVAPATPALHGSLKGRTTLVTGAARGIGAATARRLAAEGAHVVLLDRPGDGGALERLAAELHGTAVAEDITAPEAPGRIATALQETGGVDLVVHNAGVTRDRTIARMPERDWDMVLAVNLEAALRLDSELLASPGLVRQGGRFVCLSSIGGIAGNVGQTNYAASKAALIGYVQAQAPQLAKRGMAINAVAPGFIDTQMTAAMPFFVREGGRRLNALSQGGQPGDVADVVAFLGSPAASGVNGQVLRVCGQSLLGA